MKPTSIYDLSQRREIETEKRKSQQLSTHPQNGSAYDLNYVKAVTEHRQSQDIHHDGDSLYDCSIRRR